MNKTLLRNIIKEEIQKEAKKFPLTKKSLKKSMAVKPISFMPGLLEDEPKENDGKKEPDTKKAAPPSKEALEKSTKIVGDMLNKNPDLKKSTSEEKKQKMIAQIAAIQSGVSDDPEMEKKFYNDLKDADDPEYIINNKNWKGFVGTVTDWSKLIGKIKGILKLEEEKRKPMDNKKLRQLVKEALSNMVDEDSVDPGTEELEGALGDAKIDTAISANEHGVEVKVDPDADDLADQIIIMADAGLEEEAFELREFFEMDEMARTAQSYKLTDKLTNAGSFLQRVNDRIKAKTMGAGGRGRKAKEFSDEDISNMLDVLGQSTFTSQDVVSAIGRFDKVQPVNAILAKMRDKGYIDYAAELKKSAEPTSSEPKRRGRPAAQKPEDEFDAPEGEPEMGDIDTGMGDTKEQLAQLTAKMRQLAKQYAQTKDQGIVDQLRQMTKQKRDLEGELGLAENKLLKENIDPSDILKTLVGDGYGKDENDIRQNLEKQYGENIPEDSLINFIERLIKSFPPKSDNPVDPLKYIVNSIRQGDNNDLKDVFDTDDEPWTDPAGGTHYGDEDDPAAAYIEEKNTLNESKNRPMKKQLLQERFKKLANIK